MKPNEKYSYKGYQVCLFPLQTCAIAQWGPDDYSHCCSYAIDCGPAPQTLYAPCDCHVIYKTGASTNDIVYQSDKKVWTPSGLRIAVFSFVHDNNPPAKTSFKQGEEIYHTGTGGGVPAHVHIETSLTPGAIIADTGIVCSGYGNECYALQGNVQPNTVFYGNDTNFTQTLGHTFQTFKKGKPSGETLEWIITNSGLDTASRPLTEDEMKNNAKCFYGTMNILYGFTLNACCGMLGNMQSESTISPCRWEGDTPYPEPASSRGYGLVQWTPYTKILSWLQTNGYTSTDMFGDGECARINYEKENNEQWIATSAYPESFSDFAKSTKDSGTLALEFLANYERPADPNQPIRATQAQAWYDYLKDWTPVLPGGDIPDDTEKKSKFWIYMGRPF